MRINYLLLILFCTVFIFSASFSPIHSQTSTPESTLEPSISSSQKNESLVQQINELKDKIASRVAQLNLVQKHGVVGTVTESSDTRISLRTISGDIKIIDVDEITKFSSPSAKGTFGISDVGKGSILSAIGLYNKQSKHILARFVSSYTLPTFLHGKIISINKDDFTITVPTKENKNITIDIETTTKINTNSNETISKSGFTKLNEGDRVDIVGYASKESSDRITASYILQITPFTSSPTNP